MPPVGQLIRGSGGAKTPQLKNIWWLKTNPGYKGWVLINTGSSIVNRAIFWIFSFLHILFKWYMSKKSRDPIPEKKSACGKTVGGMVLFRMTLKLMKLFKQMDYRFGLILGRLKDITGNL